VCRICIFSRLHFLFQNLRYMRFDAFAMIFNLSVCLVFSHHYTVLLCHCWCVQLDFFVQFLPFAVSKDHHHETLYKIMVICHCVYYSISYYEISFFCHLMCVLFGWLARAVFKVLVSQLVLFIAQTVWQLTSFFIRHFSKYSDLKTS